MPENEIVDKPERLIWGGQLVDVTDKDKPRVVFKPKVDGGFTLGVYHPDGSCGSFKLMEQIGTDDVEFLNYLIDGLMMANAIRGEAAPNEEQINYSLSVIKGIQPKDQIEALLAAQMAVVHRLTTHYANRLINGGALAERDHAERTLNKLTRTFVSQVEGLKRYRSTSAQRIEVHHHHHHEQNVRVEDGGQAVVAQQLLAGGGAAGADSEDGGQPYAIGDSSGEALPGNVQALRPTVSRAGRTRA